MAVMAAFIALAAMVAPAASWAQPAPAASAPVPIPVPTTKILAIGHLTAKWTPEARRAVMPAEVRQTVNLYLAGKIDQWYVKQDQTGVVFLLNVTDLKEARAMLEKLPLGQAGLMEFDLIPLGPLNPLRLLVTPPAP
jgi:hypothetical protein